MMMVMVVVMVVVLARGGNRKCEGRQEECCNETHVATLYRLGKLRIGAIQLA